MSSTIYERKVGKGGQRSGSARAWAGGAGAALALGGAVAIAVGTILTRAPDAAVPAAAPAAPRLIDREMVHDAARGAAWIDGPRGYEWSPVLSRWLW